MYLLLWYPYIPMKTAMTKATTRATKIIVITTATTTGAYKLLTNNIIMYVPKSLETHLEMILLMTEE